MRPPSFYSIINDSGIGGDDGFRGSRGCAGFRGDRGCGGDDGDGGSKGGVSGNAVRAALKPTKSMPTDTEREG